MAADSGKDSGRDSGRDSGEPDKLVQAADEAVAAARRALDSETGRKVADAADAGFARAGEVIGSIIDRPTQERVRQGADDMFAKAGPIGSTTVGRNVMAGAAVGFFVGLVFSVIGIFWGTILGAGLGFLRTITKRP